VVARVWPFELSGLEDVIDDVDEAIGSDRITLEDLRLIDKVVEAVEGMQAQLIPVILLTSEGRYSD